MDGRLNGAAGQLTVKYVSLNAVNMTRTIMYAVLCIKMDTINMKKIIKITALLVMVILAANASAQSGMTEQQKAEAKARYQELKQKLNLTDDQSKKVDAINTTWFEGIAELKRSNQSRLAKRNKFKSLNNARDKQMKDVLTKEQFRTYKANQKEMKEEFKQRRANRE